MSVKLDVGCIWQEEGHFGYGEEARDFDGNGRTTPGGMRRKEEKGGEGRRREGEDIQTKRKEEKNNKEGDSDVR